MVHRAARKGDQRLRRRALQVHLQVVQVQETDKNVLTDHRTISSDRR